MSVPAPFHAPATLPAMGLAAAVTPVTVWSDSLFDCASDLSSCCISCLLPPVRWAQTAERAGLMRFSTALATVGVPAAVAVGLYVAAVAVGVGGLQDTLVVLALCAALVAFAFGWRGRGHLRRRYGIEPDECADCAVWFFCSCCAVAHEARHVDRDVGILVGGGGGGGRAPGLARSSSTSVAVALAAAPPPVAPPPVLAAPAMGPADGSARRPQPASASMVRVYVPFPDAGDRRTAPPFHQQPQQPPPPPKEVTRTDLPHPRRER